MSQPEHTLSVILCAYTEERWNDLVEAVASIKNQYQPPGEIILVIDHNPALLEQARMKIPGVIVIENAGPKGLSGARNSGIIAAKGQIIAFMDEDALAAPDWLSCLSNSYRDSSVIGVGGAIIPLWPEKKPEWFPEEFQWVVGCSYRGLPVIRGAVRNLIGCNMSFRQDAFNLEDGFRDGIGRIGKRPLGCEETEFCIRLLLNQPAATLLYDPMARVDHRVTSERTTVGYFISRCFSEGLSKSLVARFVGSRSGLASERTYTYHTLPAGLRANIRDGLFRGDLWGFARAAAIIAGFSATTLGYISGKALHWVTQAKSALNSGLKLRPSHQASSTFEPIRTLTIDISQPIQDVQPSADLEGKIHNRARALVHMNGEPLGLVDLFLEEGGLPASQINDQIWHALGEQIHLHLSQVGLPEASNLDKQAIWVEESASPQTGNLIPAPLVSVLIATRDRPESLAKTLDALRDQDYPDYEIIVVDNAPSSNASVEVIQARSNSSPPLRYLREDIAGLSIAHNHGLAEARGEIIAITDDDVIVSRTWISRLVRNFVDEKTACVTGMILPIELETPSQVWIEEFGGFAKGFERRVFDLVDNCPQSPLYPFTAGMFGSGANMAFRTTVLQQLGGFDSALGAGTPALGGDDLAAFYTIISHGYQLVYEPAAIVFHRHRRDYAGLQRQAYGYGVGLAAYLTKIILDQPGMVYTLGAKIPAGLAYLLSPRSPKNSKKSIGYPRELTYLEYKGFFHGPIAYLRSRRRWRQVQKEFSGSASSSPSYQPVAHKISPQ